MRPRAGPHRCENVKVQDNERGSAGARYAAALLGIALAAQATASSLEEDGAKIDLKISFRNAFAHGKLVSCACQVKSGLSYCSATSDAETVVLQNVGHAALEPLLGCSAALLAWVPSTPHREIYWHVVDPRRPLRTPVRIPRSNLVTPALRFELTRASVHAYFSNPAPQQTVKLLDEAATKSRAKSEYAELKKAEWQHPLFGALRVTRLAWRHVTKRSRPKSSRNAALGIVPYLASLLTHTPHRYVTDRGTTTTIGERTTESRYVRCWYRRALQIGGEPHTVVMRVLEQVSYPTEWSRAPLSICDVGYSATLASWWHQPSK